MSAYDAVLKKLNQTSYTWLITGVAGFVGSNLLQTLLRLNQKVVGLDNFSTGFAHNLERVRSAISEDQWKNFQFIEGDIRNLEDCYQACAGVDYVLHQAALGSVPRSIENPAASHASNVDGFVNLLLAAKEAKISRFVYASSSSVYGDSPLFPKVEDQTGSPISPYALTKKINEQYADVFSRCYGMECIGLRYFNIFGPHQDPHGAYAAVMPRWANAMIAGEPCYIFGDGLTSRDFCYIENAIQANLLAAITQEPSAVNQVYNVAVGDQTTLTTLFLSMRSILSEQYPSLLNHEPVYKDFRAGDVAHSLADIQKAKAKLGYEPSHSLLEGLKISMNWYIQEAKKVDLVNQSLGAKN